MRGRLQAVVRRYTPSVLAVCMVGCADLTLPGNDGTPPDVTEPKVPPPPPPPSLPPRNPYIPVPGAISLADANGTELRFLVPGSWPSWSPDGRMIAFEREGSVWVIGVDGASERMLGPGFEPAWSPDGHTIAFSSVRGIEVMTLDGKGRRVLLSREDPFDGSSPWPLGLRKPAWAPDGSRIAFERDGDGDLVFSHVYVAHADGTAPRRVTTASDFFSQESDPVWSPDGLEIVFWSLRHGVARAPASGGSPRPAYANFPAIGYGARSAWSPGGGIILFGEHVGSNVDASVWAVAVSGGQPRVVVQWATMPAWSPDGKWIAVVGVGVPRESPVPGAGRER